MSRDSQLDRLKSEEQSLFRAKQVAWQSWRDANERVQDAYDLSRNAWQARCVAREAMNSEYDAMQQNSDHYREVWDEYGRIRDYNNSRIESLRAAADYEHQQMQECFDRASYAYSSGDKASAPYYSQQGHDHKDRRDDLNAEVSALVNEVKEARQNAEWRAPKTDSSAFHAAKNYFEQAKAEHKAREIEFKNLKSECDRLKADFDRLNALHKQAKEEFQAYYGGLGSGDGFGHGHTALDRNGRKTYKRNAFEKHGGQNYIDNKAVSYSTFEGHPAKVVETDIGNSHQKQIFYGGKGKPDGKGHNHVNVVGDKLQFWREDGKVIYQDDKKRQHNDL